jgi:hypothetical protein
LISHVTPNGKGHQANIKIGEKITEINGNPTKELIHVMAQKMIKNTGQTLTLTLEGTAPPSSITTSAAKVTKQSAYKPLVSSSAASGATAAQYRGKKYQVDIKSDPKEIVNAPKSPNYSHGQIQIDDPTSFPPPPSEVLNQSDHRPSVPPPPVETRPSVLAPKSEIDSYKTDYYQNKTPKVTDSSYQSTTPKFTSPVTRPISSNVTSTTSTLYNSTPSTFSPQPPPPKFTHSTPSVPTTNSPPRPTTNSTPRPTTNSPPRQATAPTNSPPISSQARTPVPSQARTPPVPSPAASQNHANQNSNQASRNLAEEVSQIKLSESRNYFIFSFLNY